MIEELRQWRLRSAGEVAEVVGPGGRGRRTRAQLEELAECLRRGDAAVDLPRSAEGPPQDPGSAIPLVVGDYVVTDAIGAGAFGEVYGARDLHSGERVAIKVLREGSEQRVQAFKEEGRILANVHRPGLLAPDEVIQFGGVVGLVMPYVEGVDFATALTRAAGTSGAVADTARARALVAGLASALASLHHEGRAHLDVKPSNVLVDAEGAVFLLDFGLAAEAHAAGDAPGTLRYLAPEVLMGAPPGPAADCWALGAVLFEVLAGRGPYDDHPDPVMMRTLAPAPPLSAARPGIDEPWPSLCAALLDRDPARRPTADDVLARCGEGVRAVHAEATFAGRNAQSDALERAWAEVNAGGLPVFFEVTGPSGIGKTEIVRQFAMRRRAEAPGSVLWGRCFERETIPYRALDQVVASLAARIASCPVATAALTDHPDVEALRRVFPAFAPADAGPPGESTTRDREGAAACLRAALTALTAEQVLLVVIDDAQWGDLDSAELLASLLAPPSPPRVLVVATRRTDVAPGPLMDALHARVRQGLSLRLLAEEVGPLDEAAVDQILDALEVERVRKAEIKASASGNPFLVRMLADEAQPGRGLDAVVAERLASLGPLRPLVHGAALAQGPVDLRVLAAATGVDFPTRSDLGRLAALGLVRPSPGAGRAVVLYHDRLRDPVLAEVSEDDRRSLHEAFARALERLKHDPSAVATHLLAAGHAEEAADHALRAADAAEAASAFGRLAELLALSVAAGRPDPSGAIRDRLARALRATGDARQAAAIWSALAEELPDTPDGRKYRERAGEALLENGDVPSGLALLSANLVAVGERPPPSGARAALGAAWSLLSTLLRRGRIPLASARDEALLARADATWAAGKCLTLLEPLGGVGLLFTALDRAARGGDARRAARVQAMLAASILNMLGPTQRIAADWLDAVERLGRETGDPYLAATALLWRTLVDLAKSRLDAVVEGGRRALALLEPLPDTNWERAQAASFVVKAHVARGDFAACAAVAEAFRRDARRRGDLYGEMLFGGYAIPSAIARGDPDAARRGADWILETWMPDRYTVQRYYTNSYHVLCDLLDGAPDRAATRLAAEWAPFRRAGLHRIVFSRVDHDVLEARVGLVRPGAPGLRDPVQIAAGLRREGLPDARGHAALVEGIVAHRAGRADQARAAWDAAIEAFDEAGVRLEPALVDLARARLDGDAVRADDARRRARGLGVRDPDGWARSVVGLPT